MKTLARSPSRLSLVSSVAGSLTACITLFAPAAVAQTSDAQAAAAAGPGITVTIPPCRLSEHEGIDDADATTAGRLVCAEIAHAGPPANARYRVSLGKLGSVIILSVAREGDTVGSTEDSREIRLQGIEEVSVAAPRVADSIVNGTPLKETEKVDNLVGEETRVPKTKPGKVHFALGLVGMLPPLTHSASPGPGVDFDVHYEASQFEVGGSFRFGGLSSNDGTKTGSTFVDFSVGGRFYVTETDFSPYIGGGLAWDFLQLDVPGVFSGSASGLGAYADVGIEVLRTHRAHLAIGARLDVPFYSLTSDTSTTFSPAGTLVATPASSYYYAPLSLEARLTF